MVLRMVYDTLASFTCPRTITFRDYRLGFTHKALVVAIAAYVCANLFMGQLYLVDSVPLGLVSMWSSPTYSGSLGDASFEDARDEFFRRYRKAGGEPYRYCDNPDYDYVFEFDKSFNDEDIECEFAESAQVAVKGESQMFFSTMIQQNSVAYVKKPQGGECDRAAFSAGGHRRVGVSLLRGGDRVPGKVLLPRYRQRVLRGCGKHDSQPRAQIRRALRRG